MKRLTTDTPTSNTEMLLNFAYAKDGRVTLRGLDDGEGDVDLCDYIEQQRRELGFGCGVCAADVMDGACMECDCVLAVLNILAVQAAELRARCAMYEDAGPVRERGEWIGEGDGYADGEIVYDVWYCSECNHCIDDGTDDPSLLPNFCPSCGADMRKEKPEA